VVRVPLNEEAHNKQTPLRWNVFKALSCSCRNERRQRVDERVSPSSELIIKLSEVGRKSFDSTVNERA
jgi:hypothetical protein